ncbi:MAG: DinB family protein [Chloroflexota bacterium]|nr:DinB family protein [Chloroflexota bacterium]
MTTSAPDRFLLEHAPAAPRSLDPALVSARDSLRAALAELRTVRDDALERRWPWRGDAADVRYGFYRQYEELEGARAAAGRALVTARESDTPARPLVAAATAARWDLHGLLAGLADDDLDRDPGNGEWSLRQTLAHIVNVQRAYGCYTAWWHSRRDAAADDFPAHVPDDAVPGFPEEEADGVGTLADVQRRLDDVLDLSAAVFAGLNDDELAVRARWAGFAVDVRFRVTRWSSHLREHTLQVEKTLTMIGRPTSEVDRLLRLVAAGYGRLEEELFMSPADEAAVAAASQRAQEAAAAVATQAREIRAAAEVPATGEG